MTIRVTPGRRFNPGSQIPSGSEFSLAGNIALVLINSKYQPKLPYVFASGNINGALANGGALLIATVTAGKVPIVGGFTVTSSVAGRIDVRYNNTQFDIINVAAGVPVAMPIPEGILFAATGGNLDFVNNTGGAINIAAGMIWAEYTP